MTQFAYFDHTHPAPSPVLGWYDTSILNYPSLPAAADLLQITADQWSGRTSGQWAVSAGSLVTYVPPAPAPATLTQQAQTMLNTGISIQSTGDSSLDAVYACSLETQVNIQAEIISLILNSTFTNGEVTIPWPDIGGVYHTFDVNHFKDFATKIGTTVGILKAIITAGSGTLPIQPVVIA